MKFLHRHKKFFFRLFIAAGIAMAAAAGTAGLLFLYRHPPEQFEFYPRCLFFHLTGFYCPGCGNTRALYALLHGNLLQSLRCNAMLLPLLLCVIILIIFPGITRKAAVGRAVLIVIACFWVLRNLPFFPFTLLIPAN